MARIPKSLCEVEEFLLRMNEILKKEKNVKINNAEWADGRVNKTRLYMAEKNIKKDDITQVLQKLQAENYSYTEADRNENFKGQDVWIFGIKEHMVDEMENIYIKLKKITIKEDYIVVVSFHPEKPPNKGDELTFPYQKGNKISKEI